MANASVLFFDQFDRTLREDVIEYAKYLTGIEADVMVIMARKAVCFIECLETIKYASIGCFVTSDRILDMDTSWLKGKRIALVDDTLISGTTLYRTREALTQAGAEVTTHVFCVDTDWWSRDLIVPNSPYLELTDLQTNEVCTSIVNAISLVPRPYSVDFPLYTNFRIPVNQFDRVATLHNWEMYDLSSSLQHANNVISRTILPGDSVLSDLDLSLGWNFSDYAQLAKVRIYGSLHDTKRKIYQCNVMPVVAFDPLSENQVDDLFGSVITHAKSWTQIGRMIRITKETFVHSFQSSESKLRFIQYIVSARLGKLWTDAAKEVLTSGVQVEQNMRNINYLFPPLIGAGVRLISEEATDYFKDVQFEKPEVAIDNTIILDTRSETLDYFKIQNALTEPFINLFETEEIQARELVRKWGRAVFDKHEYKRVIDRLRRGYSLPQMLNFLSEYNDEVDMRRILSLFIDIAIDRGIIVPLTITDQDQGKIYRAFRHGEDIRFALSEARLACYHLKGLADGSSRENLPHFWVEKALVIFIRHGIQAQFLDVWEGALGEIDTVGVRYALKGAIVRERAENLYRPAISLTETFLQRGFLVKDKNDLYCVGDIPSAPIKGKADKKTYALGHLIGRLLTIKGDNNKTVLTIEDLISLTACLLPQQTAAALAAEIDIFVSQWKWERTKYSEFDPLIKAENILALRSKKFFESVNSGMKKFYSFKSREAWGIIERIERELSHPSDISLWLETWPQVGENKENSHPQLRELVSREGAWCISINILLRMLEVSMWYFLKATSIRPSQKKKAARNLLKVTEEIEECSTILQDYYPSGLVYSTHIQRLRQSIEEANLDADGLRRYVLKELDSLCNQAPAILAQVDSIVNNYGRPRKAVEYSHAMYVNIRSRGGSVNTIYKRCFEILKKHENIGMGKSIGKFNLSLVPNGYEGFTSGRWICSSGIMSRDRLIKLACEICEELYNVANIQITVMVDLSSNETLWRTVGTSNYRGSHFWRRARQVVDLLGDNPSVVQVNIITPILDEDSQGTQDVGFPTMKQSFRLQKQYTQLVEEPSPLNIRVKEFLLEGKDVVDSKADIGIITVVEEETKAVVSQLKQHPGFEQNKGKKHRRTFYEGNLPGNEGDYYRTVCVQQIDQGNRSVVSAYDALCDEYKPSLIILLGIAGGISDKIALTDVVVADQIIYYDKRKVHEKGTSHRTEVYKIEARLKQLLNDYFVRLDDSASLASDDLFRPRFFVKMGPIASGEAVIALSDAEERRHILQVNDKTLAVETESGGLAQAFYEGSLMSDRHVKGYLIIRGISDHADKAKDDLQRRPACDNAVRFLVHFIKELSRQDLSE